MFCWIVGVGILAKIEHPPQSRDLHRGFKVLSGFSVVPVLLLKGSYRGSLKRTPLTGSIRVL